MYPNPFTDKITVRLGNSTATLVSTTIYNSLGLKVLSTKTNTLNTTNLATGVYFLTIKTTKGSFTKKIIKQ